MAFPTKYIPKRVSRLFEGTSLVAVTASQGIRETATTLYQEHPYLCLFIAIYGVLLWPMSSTVVLGTFVLGITAAGTALAAIGIFLPILTFLTVTALGTWIVSAGAVATYRSFFKGTSARDKRDLVHRNHRWRMYAKTLEVDVRTVRDSEDLMKENSQGSKAGSVARAKTASKSLKRTADLADLARSIYPVPPTIRVSAPGPSEQAPLSEMFEPSTKAETGNDVANANLNPDASPATARSQIAHAPSPNA